MRLEFPPIGVRALDRQIIVHGAEPERSGGGKPAAAKLLRPVKRNSKRARFLSYFFDNLGRHPRRASDVAQWCGISRANVFAHWTAIHREHGIGYALEGDFITPILPPDCPADSIFK